MRSVISRSRNTQQSRKTVFLLAIVAGSWGISIVSGCYDTGTQMFDSIWDAIEREDQGYISEYASSGGDMDAKKFVGGQSLLEYAHENNAKTSFQKLLDVNASIEIELSDHTRIIHQLVLDDDTWWLKELIKSRADVDAWSNGEGSRCGTPLHFTLFNNNIKAVELLLDAEAKVNCPSNQFGSPTLYDASMQNRWEIVSLLLMHGGDPTYGPSGKSLISSLSKRGFGIANIRPMKGLGQAIRLLSERGYGEEVFQDCLWGDEKYGDYLRGR